MKIEQAVLRGVESFGMLCSAHECGWVAEPGEREQWAQAPASDGGTEGCPRGSGGRG